MRENVIACAKALLPPKDSDEVAMVARAGNEIVPLLKYKTDYSAKESCQCIHALVKIGTDAALDCIAEYARTNFEERDRYLIGQAIGPGWDVFDQGESLSQVLSHLTELSLADTQVIDVEPLKDLSKLEGLSLVNTQVTEVESLKVLKGLSIVRVN